VYYPSTAAAVAGVSRDVVRVFGIDLFPTPTYRDVARAPGRFPLILYSHGSGGVRFESLVLAVHLASHGYLVVSADHHGDTLGDSGDTHDSILSNRPRDLTFLIDQFLAFDAEGGTFFAGAIDANRIGATGHSYGGHTVLALAVGSFSLGTFTEPRVRAILPLDGSAFEFAAEAPALYTTIHVPTLLLTASYLSNLDNNQEIFDTMAPGPSVVGLANFLGGGHNSFPDTCEVPEAIRGVLGVLPECEPLFLPWRHARHIESYLALNFFDASLGGSAEARARLDPAVLADIEEIAYLSK
jgi:dienelactone hydrolase